MRGECVPFLHRSFVCIAWWSIRPGGWHICNAGHITRCMGWSVCVGCCRSANRWQPLCVANDCCDARGLQLRQCSALCLLYMERGRLADTTHPVHTPYLWLIPYGIYQGGHFWHWVQGV